MTLIENLQRQYLIPVIRENSADLLEGTCLAMAAGGLTILEVTLMSDAAFSVIQKLSSKNNLTIGAGTVLNVEQAQRAIDNGAKFLISPGLNLDIVDLAKEEGIPIFPGVLTPSEIMAAQAEGCETLKIFPISAVGGAAYLSALKGPFPNLKWMPTGGVTLETVPDFRRAGALCVGMGGKLIPQDAVQAKDWTRLTKIAAEHVHFAQA
jgi:2-dehydro-3-deoxyphosphogluconate aldolase/(4S)-4-hydroxy-2-oxoglutarate aldolase